MTHHLYSGIVSGCSPHWIKIKNPNAPAVKRGGGELGPLTKCVTRLSQRPRDAADCGETDGG